MKQTLAQMFRLDSEAYCPECKWEGYWWETVGGNNICPMCSTHCVSIENKEEK